jgi:hypothetical protein
MSFHFEAVKRRAKKQLARECFACGLPIVRGDLYFDGAAVQDGRFYKSSWHDKCDAELDRHTCYDADGWPEHVLAGSYIDHADCSPAWLHWYNDRRAQTEKP